MLVLRVKRISCKKWVYFPRCKATLYTTCCLLLVQQSYLSMHTMKNCSCAVSSLILRGRKKRLYLLKYLAASHNILSVQWSTSDFLLIGNNDQIHWSNLKNKLFLYKLILLSEIISPLNYISTGGIEKYILCYCYASLHAAALDKPNRYYPVLAFCSWFQIERLNC